MTCPMSDDPVTPLPLPRGVTLEHEAGELRVRHRWYSPFYLLLVLFCALWIGILVSWCRAEPGRANPGDFALWFPLLHIAVGLNLAYATVAGFVNHTLVQISSRGLTIRHGPLPWPGGRTIPAAEITHVYYERTEFPVYEAAWGKNVHHRFGVETRDGRKRTLLTCLSADVPRFVAEAAERHLGTAEGRATGEVPK
jgi:hypothetical protein